MSTHTDLFFLHSGFTPQCTARVNKYFEGYYTLQFMYRGAIELYYEQQRYLLEGPWFWPAYPGPHIRFHSAPDHLSWEHRYVAFQGPLISHWQAEGLWPATPQPATHQDTARHTFDELLHQAQRSDRWGRLRAINLLERLLLELAEARAEQQQPQQPPWLTLLFEQLENCPDLVPDYEQIATTCGMGLSTLRRLFKHTTGTSLHTYVLQRRINTARTLLGETDLSISAIATKLGYQDIYFFSRQFHQLTGVSPTTYRKSRQT